MFTNPEDIRSLMAQLELSVWTSSAIGALFESGLAEHLQHAVAVAELSQRCASLSRDQIQRCLDVAASVGLVVRQGSQYRLVEAAGPFATPPLRAAFCGNVRAALVQALALLNASRGSGPGTDWRSADDDTRQSQGDASSALAPFIQGHLAPLLDGLTERIERPGARFLDIGVGVAALAMSMCRVFPELSVVGLDSLAAPLALARANVKQAGLDGRIELRQCALESFEDRDAFDLAWLPSFFIPNAAPALERVHAALRPGGWLLLAINSERGSAQQQAVESLMTELWGGSVLRAEESEARLRALGFGSVRTLPGPAWAPTLVVAKR